MLFYVRRHTSADGSFEWYVPQWSYETARGKTTLLNRGSGRSMPPSLKVVIRRTGSRPRAMPPCKRSPDAGSGKTSVGR